MIENVPVRIARPLNNNENLPAIVYFHGGAFYMGSVGKFYLTIPIKISNLFLYNYRHTQ